jgi:class 3 adenylate cyclase
MSVSIILKMATPQTLFLHDWETLQQMMRGEAQELSDSHRLALLLRVWNSHDEHLTHWKDLPTAYCFVGSQFLARKLEPLAREVAEAGLAETADKPDENSAVRIRLRITLGQALAKTENTAAAQALLLQLYNENQLDEETVGSLASTYKEQAFAHPVGSATWIELLKPALQYYRAAYEAKQIDDVERAKRFWTGINVATLQYLSGNQPAARELAGQIKVNCTAGLPADRAVYDDSHYWHLATLGEVCLIEGNVQGAEDHYLKASQLAGNQFAKVLSTRRHAAWLLQQGCRTGCFSPDSLAKLDRWLPLPQVVVFAGHMLDSAERVSPRFPPHREQSVRESMLAWLSDRQPLVGFSSAAPGADILFQEVLQSLGGESRIILPYDEEQFAEDSVRPAGVQWLDRYRRVLQDASQVITASPHRLGNQGLAYHYANLVMQGWASQRMAQLYHDKRRPTGLVVWDGKPGDGFGGTASAVRQWRQGGLDVHQIDVSTDSTQLPIVLNPACPEAPDEDQQAAADESQIMSILFADVVNFGRLNDEQIMRFVRYLLRPIAGIVDQYGPVTREDRGDGFKLVFNHVRAAGLCALSICDFIRRDRPEQEWNSLGLPGNLNLRIGLHAGPVSGYLHPLTNLPRYTGSHVIRAARLEPKTPAGEAYASEAFAALMEVYGVTDFRCQYVKQLQLAKQYGTFPAYVLRR